MTLDIKNSSLNDLSEKSLKDFKNISPDSLEEELDKRNLLRGDDISEALHKIIAGILKPRNLLFLIMIFFALTVFYFLPNEPFLENKKWNAFHVAYCNAVNFITMFVVNAIITLVIQHVFRKK